MYTSYFIRVNTFEDINWLRVRLSFERTFAAQVSSRFGSKVGEYQPEISFQKHSNGCEFDLIFGQVW